MSGKSFKVLVYDTKFYTWHVNNYMESMFRGKPLLSDASRDEVFSKDMISDLFGKKIKGIEDLR